MRKTIYNFKNYKEFMKYELRNRQPSRGLKAKLAKVAGVQSAYISQVLNGAANLTLEQAEKACAFFEFSKQEKTFFILLVEYERAGTHGLKSHFLEEINQYLQKIDRVKSRIVTANQQMSTMDKIMYYSSWEYIAVYVLCSIPGLNNLEALSKKLKIEKDKTLEVLNFLIEVGHIEKVGNQYKILEARIHLEDDDPLIKNHHTNWRVRAIESIKNRKSQDLFFSTAYSFSKKDQAVIKKRILTLISELDPLIIESKEEVAGCINIDFFEI